MKHNLKISVSKKPTEGGVVRCRRVSMRERLLRHFFGEKRRVMVIVPGDSVECVSIEVLKDIADEERVHAGEFLRLLKELAPDEEKFYQEGAEEAEEEIKKSSF